MTNRHHELGEKSLIEIEETTSAGRQEMAAARLEYSAIKLLNRAMRSSGKSQKELADTIGVGESRVSQVLRGDGNMKVSTLARYLRALGYQGEVSARPVDEGARPIDSVKKRTRRSTSEPDLQLYSQIVYDGAKSSHRMVIAFANVAADATIMHEEHMGKLDTSKSNLHFADGVTISALNPWQIEVGK